ncbi:MAG: hypothetical protein CMK32_00855 [Porticoccaceae bacterium]|nr:hypothetical protein [Porticoccaceae bacterium]
MVRLIKHLACCLGLSLTALAGSPARGQEAVVILSGDNHYYHQAARTMISRVKATAPEFGADVRYLSSLETVPIQSDQLVITIGTGATERVLKQFPHQQQLGLFVTESAWRNALERYGGTTSRKAVIYVNQPLRHYVTLARMLKPDGKIIGSAFGSASRQYEASLRGIAAQEGFSLASTTLGETDNPVTSLTPVMAQADVFIAIPDQATFNRNIARWALYLAYQQKIPLIGFSQSYTRAGALASIYSSPDDIGDQAGDWLIRFYSAEGPGTQLWSASHPRNFTLNINASVAMALGYRNLSEADLYRTLRQRVDSGAMSDDAGVH